MGKSELEVRKRLEGDNLAVEPRMGEVTVTVELAKGDLHAERPGLAQKTGHIARVDVLKSERRKRRSVIALRQRAEMADAPPHLFLSER